ncbi:DNA-binding protein [Pyrobaculum aerophilum]|jgi:predicted nucleic acid-binding protein|uniref:DNA-binding protein n=1 Tax=Pyrobaculum aerophilum TaxID=13773 RepID=UPI0023F28DE0|nr:MULTISPECIES: DNA-binding protein [Pyrobaculum]MCX8137853.1 DNA-binding protein [Pyrobaculum aerophilum]
MEAIADTSFLIDWARYSKRHLLHALFQVVNIPESVLGEIYSENTLGWITEELAAGRMALFTETEDVITLARRVISLSRSLPMRGVDLPEAICLVAGLKFGYVVLTENGGAAMAPSFIQELSNVKVMRAIDVLYELSLRGVLNLREEVERYQRETGHRFAKRDLKRIGVE